NGEQGIVHCPAMFFEVPVPADAVWLHDDADTRVAERQELRIGDVVVRVRESSPRDPVLFLGVALNTGKRVPGIAVNIGLGTDPTIARTILSSIRPAS